MAIRDAAQGKAKGKPTVATIGYQGATVPGFLNVLRRARIDLLVDIRAVASSRRPGFSKTQLAASLEEAGIDYVHLRSLGTPASGRAAARADRFGEMRAIYREHLATHEAQSELGTLIDLIRSGRRVCLLCFETDATNCHRSIVAAEVAARLPVKVTHLAGASE